MELLVLLQVSGLLLLLAQVTMVRDPLLFLRPISHMATVVPSHKPDTWSGDRGFKIKHAFHPGILN